MDLMGEGQFSYQEDVYGGSQKRPYHGGGAISALAEDEMIGEDDEYDDLYNDVNVGEGFLQLPRSQVPGQSAGVMNRAFHTQKTTAPEPTTEKLVTNELNIQGVPTDGKFLNAGFPQAKERLTTEVGPDSGVMNVLGKTSGLSMTHDAQALNAGFRGAASVAQKNGVASANVSSKIANEFVPLLNPNTGVQRGGSQIPSSQMNVNVNMNRPNANDNLIRQPADNGATMLYVGELHWWTTDVDIERAASYYGRVKEIKFFDERASGKSKGYCQVEFYDSAAAAACKEGMDGHIFNGRPCVVAFASPQAMRQMSNKSLVQTQPQPQQQGRRPMNDGAGRGGGTTYPSGDSGRGFGRGGWARGQGAVNRGAGNMRGRGGTIGPKNMVGNSSGMGNVANGGGYGPGIGGAPFGGPPGAFMHPQGMMGTGFDPTYMGRGSGYGGFPGPAFPGMIPPFPNINAMGLAGVSPHVNPAFFGRGMTANGLGMMGNPGMDGPPHAGMWNDANMGGWRGEEHGPRTRESSYGGEDGGEEYGYGDPGNGKGARSNAASREKERVSDREWSENSDKRHRDERDQDRDRYDRVHRYKDEKDDHRDHRQKDRDSGYVDDWDRGQTSSRSRSRSRAMPEEDYRSRSRSRDADYGRRRRQQSD
ncbi:cleavage and polyadenylation specificity factor subunit 6 [Heracleum sosnowskyi]|uniref:Cleavage and polyadenylation specificity factor subunit 6 n=1 Tax=Heracleum sosnowskyi TaxID=360622 RepID=A0AAD8I4I4_9APIA|nr:cleavage and polyadenylation specificity factor subunit 6 [Heracleum sosnowskyi]